MNKPSYTVQRTLPHTQLILTGLAVLVLVAINASRAPALGRFLYALGIRHIGEVTARDLARTYPQWPDIETLLTTPEIGLVTLSLPEAFGEPAAAERARAARVAASALRNWARDASTSCRATMP